MNDQVTKHKPVLLREVLDYLGPERGGLYLDGTFGGGGHARAVLEASEGVRMVALDQDPDAAKRAEVFKEEFGDRFKFYDLKFGNLNEVAEEGFQGILLDIGMSSFQMDEGDRGFAFRLDGPADMRLNPREGIPASEFLETASLHELTQAVRNLGEERSWARVVKAIIEARGTGALSRTASLAELISKAIGPQYGNKSRIHPATKTFQGIRMAVNDELGELERVLPVAFEKLAIGGVLVVISFHSLEDRIVKRFFRRMAGQPEHSRDSKPQDLRFKCAEMLTKRPVSPSKEEISDNPRSRSSRLRAIKKEKDYKEI